MDFPIHPQTNIELFETTSDIFKEFKDLLNYVTKDELRPAMTGIGFMQHEGNFQMCATDGHRLKFVTVPELKNDDKEMQHFILNAKAANILSSLNFQPKGRGKAKVETMPESVTVCSSEPSEDGDKSISFLFSYGAYDMEVITKDINERYPQYWDVIPSKSTTQFTIDKKNFLNVLDKAVLFANKTTNQIRLSLNGSNKISAEDLDFSHEYTGEVGGTYEGNHIEIGFNGAFLKEVINSFDDVTLEMSEPNKAAVIRKGNSLALVMPVMLNQYI